MSYTTKVIYSTYADFSYSENVTESGKPASVELENLASNQNYYTKAELMDNKGTLLDTSDVSTFRTLEAGTINLTYVSTTRIGNNYIANFTYASTYALSSAIMSIDSTNVQGIITGNAITFTISGLTHGDSYPYNITATDIYTESSTTSGVITTTVVNDISITGTVAAETSMRLDLSYTTDSGFRSGYGECWAMEDDPDTDQPISYAFFSEGDTYVVVPNINVDTQYQFRATIELQDNTEVYSNVVVARTITHDYSQDYFTIKNEYGGMNTITLTGIGGANPYSYSTDNGNTWTTFNMSVGATKTIVLYSKNDTILLKHSGSLNPGKLTNNSFVNSTQAYSVSGNIASLCFGDNFNTGSALTMPDNAYYYMFYNQTNLVSAKNLTFASYEETSRDGMCRMFYGCTGLVSTPDLSTITTVGMNGMNQMFYGCTSLTETNVDNVETVKEAGMYDMFNSCTSLTTGPDLRSITSVVRGQTSLGQIFRNCTSLTTVYAPTITWRLPEDTTNNWLYGVAAKGIIYAVESVAKTITHSRTDGCPSGWYTDVEATKKYHFTIRNLSENTNNIYISSNDNPISLKVSTDNGTTWNSYSSDSQTVIATLAQGEAVIVKGVTPFGKFDSDSHTFISSDYEVSLAGNIASLWFEDNFNTGSILTMPDNAFYKASQLGSNLVSIENLYFDDFDIISANALYDSFNGSTNLFRLPDMSCIRKVDNYGLRGMFYGCTSLTESPNLSGIIEIGDGGLNDIFNGCIRLVTAYAPTITWDTSKTNNWLSGIYTSGTLYADISIVAGIPDFNPSGCPSGWTRKRL